MKRRTIRAGQREMIKQIRTAERAAEDKRQRDIMREAQSQARHDAWAVLQGKRDALGYPPADGPEYRHVGVRAHPGDGPR
jgi:hypothetical protein